jgi:hypothetical protein
MPKITLKSGKTVHLGRKRPTRQFVVGPVCVQQLDGGRTKLVPLFSAHYNRSRDDKDPPASTNWMDGNARSIAQTMGNTQEGDCVIASKGHILGVWTGNEIGAPLMLSDVEALDIYHALCGGGDQGCVITDVLDAMKAGRFLVRGTAHKIDGYAAVNLAYQNEVKVCTEVFGGGISLGLNLPGSWANAVSGNGFVWDNATDSSVGGHDVPVLDYNSQGVQIATWGYWGTITWEALANAAICEEAWQALGADWYSKANLAPNGISADTLRADLALLTGGQTPPLPGPAPVDNGKEQNRKEKDP